MQTRLGLIGLSTLLAMGVLGPLHAVAADPTPQVPSPPAPSAGEAGSPAPTKPARQPVTSEFSLLISPSRLVIDRAQVAETQQIRILNQGQQATKVTVQKHNFSAERNGTLNYRQDAPYAAASWVSVKPSTFTLAPGATQVVTADITLPELPEPGDHHVALVFMVPTQEEGAGNIRVNRGIATPMFITVPGVIEDRVSLTGLSAPKFSAGGNVPITATMHNLGTVHRDFRAPYPLTVASAGKVTPFPDFTIPRGATRDISTEWDPPLMCICRPTVTYENYGMKQVQSVRVIVFPWHWFAAALGALLLIVLGVRLSRRRYRAQVLRAATAYNANSGGDA